MHLGGLHACCKCNALMLFKLLLLLLLLLLLPSPLPVYPLMYLHRNLMVWGMGFNVWR